MKNGRVFFSVFPDWMNEKEKAHKLWQRRTATMMTTMTKTLRGMLEEFRQRRGKCVYLGYFDNSSSKEEEFCDIFLIQAWSRCGATDNNIVLPLARGQMLIIPKSVPQEYIASFPKFQSVREESVEVMQWWQVLPTTGTWQMPTALVEDYDWVKAMENSLAPPFDYGFMALATAAYFVVGPQRLFSVINSLKQNFNGDDDNWLVQYLDEILQYHIPFIGMYRPKIAVKYSN